MIRINLLPQQQKKKRKSSKAGGLKLGGDNPRALAVLAIFAVTWGGLGGGAYYLLNQEIELDAKARATTAEVNKEIEELRKQIDEERLEAIRAQVNQLRTAIAQLQARKRTPAFVMHELSNILTQGKLPDVDLEEQLKIAAQDPDSVLNQTWDATSVWVTSLRQEGDLSSQSRVVRVTPPTCPSSSNGCEPLRASSRCRTPNSRRRSERMACLAQG